MKKILVIDDDFMEVALLRGSFKGVFIAWNRMVNATSNRYLNDSLREDRQYYDLTLVDLNGVGFDADYLKEYFNYQKTWIMSSVEPLTKLPFRFRFILKENLNSEIREFFKI